jgi:hypothetical protein
MPRPMPIIVFVAPAFFGLTFGLLRGGGATSVLRVPAVLAGIGGVLCFAHWIAVASFAERPPPVATLKSPFGDE